MRLLIILFILIATSCEKKTNNQVKDLQLKNRVEKVNRQEAKINKINDDYIYFIENFYKDYIKEYNKSNATQNDINKIINKYCSKKFIEILKKSDIDFDPFINAQDVDLEILKSLEITKDSSENNYFNVKYLDTYSGNKILIKIEIIEIESEFKINKILVNGTMIG